jgi:hypothetical protein
MHIINFINHDTAMMASVHQRMDRRFIVHLDDLDSDMRVQPSRIFDNVDKAAAYAESLVKKVAA